MAGRYKVTSNCIRNSIAHHFKDGKTVRIIEKLIKVSHSTAFAIIKRRKFHGTVENALKSGALHKLIPRNRRFIITEELPEESFSLMKDQESYIWFWQNPWWRKI